MIVHDLDLMGAVALPHKAHSPLVVDADAVLAFSVIFQCFQMVARRDSQTLQHGRSVKLQQLAPGSRPRSRAMEPAIWQRHDKWERSGNEIGATCKIPTEVPGPAKDPSRNLLFL